LRLPLLFPDKQDLASLSIRSLNSHIYQFPNPILPTISIMQLTSTLSYLLYAASIVVAAPIDKRQFGLGGGGSTRNDVKDGKCAPVTLIFARGSTEPGVSCLETNPFQQRKS
jgi:hypothetical protein